MQRRSPAYIWRCIDNFKRKNQIAYSYGRFGYPNSGKTWYFGGIDALWERQGMIRAVVPDRSSRHYKQDGTRRGGGYYVRIQGNDGRFYYYCHYGHKPRW